MDFVRNPFSPAAGAQPPELAGREALLERAQRVLTRVRNRRHDRSCLLVGLRGVGKTVLLNRIDQMSQANGFESVMLETPEDRRLAELLALNLRRILLRLDRVEGAKDKLRNALSALRAFAATFEVKIGDIGVGVKEAAGIADSGALDSDISDLLVAVGEAAVERGTAVALLIDELQYVPEMELGAFLTGIHRVGQLNLPLVVFGAGLPQLIGLTGKAKSYAERLFEFQDVGALQEEDARAAVREPIQREGAAITADALSELYRVTEGYPYFLQEWSSHAWNYATGAQISVGDVHAVHDETIAALDRGFFRVRFDRLTPGEKDYLRAMAELGRGPHRSGDIAARLNRTVEQVAPTRASVITKGMAFAPAHGDTAFTVPMFDDFMRRVMPEFNPRPPRKRSKKDEADKISG
ncbi:MAG TPA: ATP-binding protein [Stellaceae bacterium]|nr:ATP-binding protein [Stellaceae bacterium]